MRGTLIVHAHPRALQALAEHGRFSGWRRSFVSRFYAAWLVFTGKADALSWQYTKDPEIH